MFNGFVMTLFKKNRIIIYIFNLFMYLKRKITVKKIDESLLTNIEWIAEYNIPIKWFYEDKPKWISWVARLKNAEHFLEVCIESHLPFLDELILVDNESTDSTRKICKVLQKKYPDKVRFYEYKHYVHPYSENSGDIPSNSIHSMAYYYNRSIHADGNGRIV